MLSLEQDMIRDSEVHVPDASDSTLLKSSADVRRYAHLDTLAALPDRS